jgi:hypothetical protein
LCLSFAIIHRFATYYDTSFYSTQIDHQTSTVHPRPFKGSHPIRVDFDIALERAREGDPHGEPAHQIAYLYIFKIVGDLLWAMIKAEHARGMHAVFTNTSLAALPVSFQAQYLAYGSNKWLFTRSD